MPRPRPALAWFVAAFLVYAATGARGAIWADSAKLGLYALSGYVPSLNPGDHPGWTVLARVWLALTPFLPPIRALHLLSAACGAAAVSLLFLVVRKCADEAVSAHAAAAVLSVSLPLWWTATVTETYAAALALSLACAVLASPPRPAAGWVAGLCAGLGVAVHAFSLFLTAPVLLAQRRRRWPLIAAGAITGAAPVWLGLFGVPADPMTGHRAGRAASWAWHVSAFLAPSRLLPGLGLIVALVVYGFGVVGLAGVLNRLRHDRPVSVRWPLMPASLVLLAVILALYSPFRLHLMVLFLVAGLLLVAPPRLSPAMVGVHLGAQVALYLAVPALACAAGLGDLGARRLPDRNNAAYFLSPMKCREAGPERYARGLLDAAPQGAVILADFNPGALLLLVQTTEHLRPDVEIVPTAIDELAGDADPVRALADRIAATQGRRRRVVLADSWEPYYHVRELEQRFGASSAPCGPGLSVALPAPPSLPPPS